jgi:hypothetical protein
MMMHKADLRDHLMFSAAGHNELTFLTVPDRVYRLMTHNSGRPNRRMVDYYRRTLDRLGYDAQVLITHLVGESGEVIPHREHLRPEDVGERQREIVREIRPKLAPRFRGLSDEELVVSGVFVVARKPAGSG